MKFTLKKSFARIGLRAEQGGQLLEFAMIFPLILAIIFGIIWMSSGIQAVTAFQRAVHEAPRFAITRARMENFQGAANTDIPLDCSSSVHLWHGVPPSSPNFYQTQGFQYCGASGDICDSTLPFPYLQAIAYVNVSMRLNVGNQVRFPCDPTLSSDAADGCMRCWIEEPTLSALWICASSPPPPLEHFSLVCQFRPDNILSGPIARLLGSMLGRPRIGVITERMEI